MVVAILESKGQEKNVRIITQFRHDPETMQPGEKVPKLARPNIKPHLCYYH